MLPELPFTDSVLIFAIAMFVFLTTPLLLNRYRLPGIIGIIIVGTIIGPNSLNLLERSETIILFGEIGVIYLMFIAGLEININKFIEKMDRSLVFGFLSFIIPQAAGTLIGVYTIGMSLPTALLFASIFASHTLLAYPVARRLGIVKDEAITATIGGTILTDTLALLVLAVVISSGEEAIDMQFWAQLAIGLIIFFVAVWTIVPRLSRWFFSNLTDESYFEFLFVMTVMFTCAYFSRVVGVEPIIGAFLAGLVLNRLIPNTGVLMNRIEFIGNAFFIPFFLLSVGMLVDVTIFFEEGNNLMLAFWLIFLVLITKIAAAWLTGRIYGYNINQVMSMFGLSVGQAAAALAIVIIGFDAGLFDQNMINGTIVMILVIGIVSPIIVERYGTKMALSDQAPFAPPESPQRILVPFSVQSIYKKELLDLAIMIRAKDSDEPLHALCVVSPSSEPDRKVAQAEKMLEDLTAYTSCAEVPMTTHVGLNYNIASGIIRATTENRISTIIMGWEEDRSLTESVVGSITEQVSGRIKKMLLLSHIETPLCNTQNITVLLPTSIYYNPGIYEVLEVIIRLAEETGSNVMAIVIEDSPEKYEDLFNAMKPVVKVNFMRVEGWKNVLKVLRTKAESKSELIIYIKAYKNTPGWQHELNELPNTIYSLSRGNLIIARPETTEKVNDMRFLRIE
ncbi:MAG: cation:proton antiporter [Methanolobus sp.]|uniref:cation:proton antiporter n=1 Tax=Methanolobus sp. TaxID=1874737 RepID=UPI0027305011|nr:cation:proton antiporter [Methanolobus sp.]MDP2215696.1 cation:proton antiporter [Methanolobus sp.]